MNRIDRKFRDLRRAKRSAFIAFVTAGYPDLRSTERLVIELSRHADIIEVGIPFSDPLADGPVIQNASTEALKRKTDLRKVFAMMERIRRVSQVPVCFMTYYNPVFAMGEKRFVAACRSCGVDGVIVPDLAFEESRELARSCAAQGVALIPFVSPTTSDERCRRICRAARGFIYYVSLAGVTGPRQKLPLDLGRRVAKIRRMTDTPVCVGFGVSSREQVTSLSRFCDGVIVGSAIVREIGARKGPKMAEAVARFAGSLAGGIPGK